MRADAVLETVVYADDLAAAERFYTQVVGLERVAFQTDRHLFMRCGDAMFLVFRAESTSTVPFSVGDARIPMHGAQGEGHVAFVMRESDTDAWRAHLNSHDVPIESEVSWPDGGHSIYVRDPAGNSVEFATPALWRLPETRNT